MITTMMGVIIVIIILILLIILACDPKVSNNMILMSRYKGQFHGGKRVKNSGRGPPPFSAMPERKHFCCRTCSLMHKDPLLIIFGTNTIVNSRRLKRQMKSAMFASFEESTSLAPCQSLHPEYIFPFLQTNPGQI